MVRYIKDGAYTIVVEDTDPEEAAEDGRSTTGSKRSNRTSGQPPPSERRPSRKPQTPVVEAREEEEVISDDEIDYTDCNFILQNLSGAVPKVETESTHTLISRREVASMIAEQVAFYVYCLLHAYLTLPESPTIVLFGDGHVGSSIIQKLSNCGCNSFLRIYCRGEISAIEWRNRGFMADFNIVRLLGGAAPSIVVLAADYYSFHHVFHMLTEHHLIHPETAVVSATLGFQRKKLFSNFAVPTILRVYVEPGEVQSSYRVVAEQRLNTLTTVPLTQHPIEEEGEDDVEDEEGGGEGGLGNDGRSVEGSQLARSKMSALSNESDDDDESSLSESAVTTAEKAAVAMADRMARLQNLLFVVENFFALQSMAHEDARRVALRAITGFHEGGTSPSKKAAPVLQKKERLMIKLVEKAVLQLYSATAIPFQQEWSRRISVGDLSLLAKEFVQEKKAVTLTRFQDENKIRHQRRVVTGGSQSSSASAIAAAAEAVAATQAPPPEPKKKGSKKKAAAAAAAAAAPVVSSTRSFDEESAPDGSKTDPGNSSVATGSSHGRQAFVVDQGKGIFVKNGKTYHILHSNEELVETFNIDDDYSRREGPGFAYMRRLDEGDSRKLAFKGPAATQLRIFTGEPPDRDLSLASPEARISPAQSAGRGGNRG